MAVRSENDFLLRRYLAQDCLRAAAGHDNVGQCLHFGRAVDVRQRDMVGMRRTKRFEFAWGAGVLQRAASGHVRQNDRFLWA